MVGTPLYGHIGLAKSRVGVAWEHSFTLCGTMVVAIDDDGQNLHVAELKEFPPNAPAGGPGIEWTITSPGVFARPFPAAPQSHTFDAI
jgi:hypothetical protein